MDYAKSLYRTIIESGLGDKISWYAYGVADVMDRELARLLKRAGCVGINFGVDHTDNAMLSFFNKGFRYEDVMRTVKFCREEGIKVMVDLLLGAPGETFDSLKKVIEDMKSLEPFRVGVSVIQDAIRAGFRGAFWDILAMYPKEKLWNYSTG